MANVGPKAKIIQCSAKLKNLLLGAGTLQTYPPNRILFQVDQEAVGVYLVRKGKVRLSLPELPKLDRIFAPGSLLGLPATFTGHAYSLDATSVTAAEGLHVERETFLQLLYGH